MFRVVPFERYSYGDLIRFGATRSFVSIALRKRFDDVPGELDYPLEVEIVDDRLVRVLWVDQGCTLDIFSESYLIDFVPIPLRESKVIMGMDWLSPDGMMIDFGLHLVRVRTPSRGDLVIHSEGAQRGPTLCSATWVGRYLQ